MATLKIKFPTLVTGELNTHHHRLSDMIQDVSSLIDRYNNLPADQKQKIPYRGKNMQKVIRHIHTAQYNIGQEPVLQLCIEEYKDGYDDMYLKKPNRPEEPLTPSDHLGSDKNYALMYPISEEKNGIRINRWLVIIYDTYNKDDNDLIHTVKNTIAKILEFPFKFVIPYADGQGRIYPRVEVTYTTLLNDNNDQLLLQDHIACRTARNTRKIEYVNLTDEDVASLNDEEQLEENSKRVIKVFQDESNKSFFNKYTTSKSANGEVTTAMTIGFSYARNLTNDEARQIYDSIFMRSMFAEVISNYLNNGGNAQQR